MLPVVINTSLTFEKFKPDDFEQSPVSHKLQNAK
jgi:hypothetical protein